MKISARTLSAMAGGVGIVLLMTLVLALLERQSQRATNEESVTAAEMATAPAAAAPREAATSEAGSPFSAGQDDTRGYEGTVWDAPLASVAKRRDKVTQTFTDDDGSDGPPGLASIVWMGIGLPANRQIAQAATFDPDAFSQGKFRTLRRGATQYIFENDRFVMAVASIPAGSLERVRQTMANDNQEIPSLHTEQTFDLSPPGSGLPPEALSSDCYKKANTNTRIYVIEKWSTSVAGTILHDHGFIVSIPNSDYLKLLQQAQQPR
jgi:hypothetical protein